MITSGLDIATRTLKKLQVVGAGQTPDPDDQHDVFDALLGMMDQWRLDELTIQVVQRELFDLLSGVGSYTLGPGGDFDRQRPIRLEKASVVLASTGIEYAPMDKLTLEKYQRVQNKTVSGRMPSAFYYDGDHVDGVATITVLPVQDSNLYKLALYCQTHLEGFADITTEYDIPVGFLMAIVYNLAIDVAPDFEVEPPSSIIRRASEYLGNIRRVNIKPVVIGVDEALTARSGRHTTDIRNGRY